MNYVMKPLLSCRVFPRLPVGSSPNSLFFKEAEQEQDPAADLLRYSNEQVNSKKQGTDEQQERTRTDHGDCFLCTKEARRDRDFVWIHVTGGRRNKSLD